MGLGVVGLDLVAVRYSAIASSNFWYCTKATAKPKWAVELRGLRQSASRCSAIAASSSFTAYFCESAAEGRVGHRIGWIEPDCFVILGNRLVGLPLVVQSEAES